MESRLSSKNLRILSNTIIGIFSVFALFAFLFSIDRTLIVSIISVLMLGAGLYLMWFMSDFDAVSLLVFFFGTTACFSFFSDMIVGDWLRAVAIAVFAALSFILTNYLLNLVKPFKNPSKIIYKIILSLIYTQVFWVLSLINASQISKGAIAAVIFFNFQSVVRDILADEFDKNRFAFLTIISILLLTIVFYRI